MEYSITYLVTFMTVIAVNTDLDRTKEDARPIQETHAHLYPEIQNFVIKTRIPETITIHLIIDIIMFPETLEHFVGEANPSKSQQEDILNIDINHMILVTAIMITEMKDIQTTTPNLATDT